MSAVSETELRRKMRAAFDEEEMAAIGRWFIEQLASGALDEHEMTPFEKGYWKYLMQGYHAWMKKRTLQ